MTKRPAPPQRRMNRARTSLPIVRLLTEGRRTEVEYFANWARELRGSVTVQFDTFHGTPMSLVDRAVTLVDERKQATRRGREVLFDEVWCVFDRDDHPMVPQAVALAALHGIGVALSNPCFELWLVLHVLDLRRSIERRDVQAMSANEALTVGKGLAPSAWPRLLAAWEAAEARARSLDEMHSSNGSPAASNPSTSVARLLRTLQRHRA